MTVDASPRGCRLHPSADPSTGLCPSCLRHRLSYLPRSKSLSAPRRPSLSHLFRSDPFPPHISNQFNQHEHEENAKTMKEHIDIDLQTPHSSRLWPTHKLHKWLLKQQQQHQHQHHQQQQKKKTKMINHEIPIRRRRSCDTDPRISMIEENFDEPRASWDGYMIARTIPRLPPMLSVIEKSLNEDDTNSVYESSSSGKSSGKNRGRVEIDDFKPKAIDTNVIDTPPKSTGGSLKNKVLRILGFKAKSTETAMLSGKVLGRNSYVDTYHHRSANVGATLDRARSVRYSPSPINFENGLLRFNLTPALPLSRKKKPERRSVLNLQVNARGVS